MYVRIWVKKGKKTYADYVYLCTDTTIERSKELARMIRAMERSSECEVVMIKRERRKDFNFRCVDKALGFVNVWNS